MAHMQTAFIFPKLENERSLIAVQFFAELSSGTALVGKFVKQCASAHRTSNHFSFGRRARTLTTFFTSISRSSTK